MTETDNKYYCPCSQKSYKDYIAFYYHKLTKKHKRFIGELEAKPQLDIKERRKKYYNGLTPEKKAALLQKIKEQSRLRKEKLKQEELENEPVTIINIEKEDVKPSKFGEFMEAITKQEELRDEPKPSVNILKPIKATKLTLKPNTNYKIHRCECGSIINKYTEKAHLQTKRHKFILENLDKIN